MLLRTKNDIQSVADGVCQRGYIGLVLPNLESRSVRSVIVTCSCQNSCCLPLAQACSFF